MSATAVAEAFERAPLLADRLAAEAPFPSTEAIIARARQLMAGMSEEELIAMLDAHPRIGAPLQTLSPRAVAEQGPPGELATARELAEVNDVYERRFGFRCVILVAGRSRAEILAVMRERLARSRAEELQTGIAEFLAIAHDRLNRGR
ncbi:MAG: 2-oxo-4-hydroxy-4-carboxy-5-ureidoimidazoline decarboxylase [Chloroflexota bacterium]|nr:2-oxo-4-hydroxy-4-carboxy-5-ureidoimidazoline decarboxylase [Chloroflexota bacterium]